MRTPYRKNTNIAAGQKRMTRAAEVKKIRRVKHLTITDLKEPNHRCKGVSHPAARKRGVTKSMISILRI